MFISQNTRLLFKDQLDNYLKNLVNNQTDNQDLQVYLNDALFPGRRMRPTLLFLLLGKNNNKFYHLYSAIEIIHRSSIILDDLIDLDNFRRGELTFHKKHGVEATLLVAHLLNAIAFEQIEKFETKTSISLHKYFNKCYKSMVIGEMADICLLKANSNFINFYKKVSLKKTNAVFILMFEIFATIQKEEKISLAAKFGESIGNFYQAQNDLYDDLYSKHNERGIKDYYLSCLTFMKAIILDNGNEQNKELIFSNIGLKLNQRELEVERKVMNQNEYIELATCELKRLKNKILHYSTKLELNQKESVHSFLNWVEEKNCWNHKVISDAGYQ